MSELALPGLSGINPLGFMAALGVQAALESAGDPATLRWTGGAMPTAIVGTDRSPASAADAARECFGQILAGTAVDPRVHPKLKLRPSEIRTYLSEARAAGPASSLAMCLVAENSLDNNGVAKPTDFYFSAGNQKFAATVRELLEGASRDYLLNGMIGPWRYDSRLKSLMWDVVDDRVYALSAFDPTDSANNPRRSHPGAEALAVLGLTRLPCFHSPVGTATLGCSGIWQRGSFTWPLWRHAAAPGGVSALLAHATRAEPRSEPERIAFERHTSRYEGWGITQVLQSQIRRSTKGGYGTFGPPRVIWQRA